LILEKSAMAARAAVRIASALQDTNLARMANV